LTNGKRRDIDMSKITDDDFADLEQLIDKIGLSEVLQLLADVCYAKADHIETNWQDYRLAKLWEKAAAKLDDVSVNAIIEDVGG
jgi:hypothetical protein